MINWKVRLASKTFWLALIPALLLLAQAGAFFLLSLSHLFLGKGSIVHRSFLLRSSRVPWVF